MARLYVRLATALALLMLLVGAVFYALERRGAQLYHAELTQRLNASIAMYVAQQAPLIRNGVVDDAQLATLAERAMIINPSAEIYVLDPQGRVLGSRDANDPELARQIAVAPVRALLDGAQRLPVFGDDPRLDADRKVFSASEIRDAQGLQGYVYVVLGGQQYAAAVADVRGGYQQTVLASAVALTLLCAALIGAALFWLLTRPLRRLTRRARQFEFAYAGRDPDARAAETSVDELQQLDAAFSAMQRRIEAQFERLQESDRLRRELITNVSHDLRTPLAAMQGAVDTLLIKQDALSDADARHLLGTARRHADRLNTLIKDLFELTRLDTGNIQPEFQTFSLAELINDVATEFALKAESRGIALRVEPPPGATTTVYADIGLIQRVLENLIDNAIKYTEAGGVVVVAMRPVASGHAVSISDTGVGISQQHLPRIFERHYAGSRDGAKTSDSTGIGLAIVKKILELHGTEIAVESTPREGSRFRFELPATAQAA